MENRSHEQKSKEEWANPKLFELFENNRGIVRDASRQVVQDVFREYIPNEGKILELGSGVGELLGLIPTEYASRLISTEQSLESLKVLKSQHPESTVFSGDILSLPVASGSVDTIASFSVFDTILDLDTALKETSRVLNKDGEFIHFLDIQSHRDTLIDRLPPGLVPFPNVSEVIPGEKQSAIDGFQLVGVNDYKKLVDSLDPRKRAAFDIYFKNPAKTFKALYYRRQDILESIADDVKESGLAKGKVATFKDLFNQSLNTALTQNNFKVIEQGDRTASLVLDKTDKARAKGDYNYFHNEVGALHKFRRNDLNLAFNQMQVKSTLSVTVARKR